MPVGKGNRTHTSKGRQVGNTVLAIPVPGWDSGPASNLLGTYPRSGQAVCGFRGQLTHRAAAGGRRAPCKRPAPT